MKNIPEVKLGIVAVSRDCFPMSLSESRRIKVCQEYKKAYGDIYECPTVVENENDMLKALDEVNTAGCNALVVYLGNFGPESSETLLAKKFGGPVMFVAAAEEPCGDALIDNRGDAYCGMLNASYNLALRNIKAYIPEYPVGTPDECAKMIIEFVPVARAILGLNDLKVISFLDINNTVPADIYNDDIAGKFPYTHKDTFMGFHCGNTASCLVKEPEMKFQRIMKRNLEPDSEPNISRGTLEGDIVDGNITFFRFQSTADAQLKGYIAEGEVLPVATRSFGSIGIFAINEMGRFYRHVLVQKNYPHHGAVAFGHYGKALHSVMTYLGMTDIGFNQPNGMLYPTENPFAD